MMSEVCRTCMYSVNEIRILHVKYPTIITLFNIHKNYNKNDYSRIEGYSNFLWNSN